VTQSTYNPFSAYDNVTVYRNQISSSDNVYRSFE